MAGRKKRGKIFSEDWTAIDREWAEGIGSNYQGRDRETRILMLGLSRVASDGHAHFDQGELLRLLAVMDDQGEVREPSRDAVTRSIRSMVGAGVIAQDSWVRCIRFPMLKVEYGPTDTLTACPRKPPGRASNLRAA